MTRSRFPVGRAKVTFHPAFEGNDLDHMGPTREAWLTDVYGLVIHISVASNMAARWAVSHTRSGYAIGYADTWQAALNLADRLGKCGSWNRDVEDIKADTEFHARLSEVVREHGVKSHRREPMSVWG